MILGLHHVTATVDAAQDDLDFYRDALGLRLVKKTVNFDNHNVFHFYYGNETGTPGTIWTTFPYGGWGVPVGLKGAGQIGVTSFSVPSGSLGAWIDRLRARDIVAAEDQSRFGDESITFADPSGLLIELVATDRDSRQPWTDGGIGDDLAIRGLHSVTMVVRTPDRTVEFMTSRLGFNVGQEAEGRLRLTVNGDGPGKTIEIVANDRAPAARNGLGTVHHVAMAVAEADEQLRIRQQLVELGISVTPVMDRQYFQSIYFREPGGVLFEIATVKPGFLVDEDVAQLGQALKLPPWEEPNRKSIETGLPKVDI
ncbi:MAG TPA: ring-cleaving dioxygenase [Vicinamibacterales bacterium]|nr:ring-cleaving dioxygenase [Vicinamibacterales bacterium]